MKQENNYVLSVRAAEDLKDIAQFTIGKFGIHQSVMYKKGLISVLSSLAENPEIGREYIAVKEKMVSRYRFKGHTIFFYPLDQKIFVVRILGNKMSFLKHLFANP